MGFLLGDFAYCPFTGIHTVDSHEELFEERMEPAVSAWNVEHLPLNDLGLLEQHFEEDFQQMDFLVADFSIRGRRDVFVVNCIVVHPLVVLELPVLV